MSNATHWSRRLLLVAAASIAYACGSDSIQLPPVRLAETSHLPRQLEPVGPPMLDVSGNKVRTIFWLLGFRDEYLGRPIGGNEDDKVEGFYCNEIEAARHFRRVLSRLAREQGLRDDVRERVFQECLTEFGSLDMRLALDSFYVDRRTTGIFTPNRKEVISLRATYDMSYGMGRDAKLAYLSGAYQRYGRESTFGFANAEHKADLVARLLTEVGATEVCQVNTRDSIPNGNFVNFSASSELMTALANDEP
jgi:hypothetical protein